MKKGKDEERKRCKEERMKKEKIKRGKDEERKRKVKEWRKVERDKERKRIEKNSKDNKKWMVLVTVFIT